MQGTLRRYRAMAEEFFNRRPMGHAKSSLNTSACLKSVRDFRPFVFLDSRSIIPTPSIPSLCSLATCEFLCILVLRSVWWNMLFYLLVATTRRVSKINNENRLQHRIALAAGCYSHLYAVVDEMRKHDHAFSPNSAIINLLSAGFAVRTYRRAAASWKVPSREFLARLTQQTTMCNWYRIHIQSEFPGWPDQSESRIGKGFD